MEENTLVAGDTVFLKGHDREMVVARVELSRPNFEGPCALCFYLQDDGAPVNCWIPIICLIKNEVDEDEE
jgi:hypothetical protein